MVGHETGMTFVPSEGKLMAIRETEDMERVEVYQKAPIMRPLVFVGPTAKHSEVSDL